MAVAGTCFLRLSADSRAGTLAAMSTLWLYPSRRTATEAAAPGSRGFHLSRRVVHDCAGVGRRASNLVSVSENQPTGETRAPRSRGVRLRLVCALGESLGGNATAFGYSVTITASFGAVQIGRGQPRFSDLIVFGLGAVVAFGGLEGLATGGFRVPLEKGSDQVVVLGTALAFVSVGLAIATARGIAAVAGGGWGWFGAAFCASLVFALAESLEFMFAEWLQERRGEA